MSQPTKSDTRKKPKFFLPGDKVSIDGDIHIIQEWSRDHTRFDENDDYIPDGKDYEYWEYATNFGAWYDYNEISFVEPGFMRKAVERDAK